MAEFNFVEAAAAGYRFVWRERRSILTLALIPLSVKVGSYAAISLFDMEKNFLRQGLVMLPAHFLEGFVVALVVRMALLGENFTRLFDPGPGQPQQFSESQRRAVMASAAIYLLTKLVCSFFAGSMMTAQTMEPIPSMTPPPTSTLTMTIMLIIFMVWMFRFFWLYVPAAMGVSVRQFLQAINSFYSSFYLLGLWVVCFVPLMGILIGIAKSLLILLGQESLPYMVLIAFIQAVFELGIALVAAVAMGYTVRNVMTGGPGALR